VENRHSALGDTLATAKVLVHLLDRLEAMGIHTFEEAMRACDMQAQLRFRAAHF
jgi:DNA polymerase-3 subunit epsilon